jgi:hypothetical protein
MHKWHKVIIIIIIIIIWHNCDVNNDTNVYSGFQALSFGIYLYVATVEPKKDIVILTVCSLYLVNLMWMWMIEAVIALHWCRNNLTVTKHIYIYISVFFEETERENFTQRGHLLMRLLGSLPLHLKRPLATVSQGTWRTLSPHLHSDRFMFNVCRYVLWDKKIDSG